MCEQYKPERSKRNLPENSILDNEIVRLAADLEKIRQAFTRRDVAGLRDAIRSMDLTMRIIQDDRKTYRLEAQEIRGRLPKGYRGCQYTDAVYAAVIEYLQTGGFHKKRARYEHCVEWCVRLLGRHRDSVVRAMDTLIQGDWLLAERVVTGQEEISVWITQGEGFNADKKDDPDGATKYDPPAEQMKRKNIVRNARVQKAEAA